MTDITQVKVIVTGRVQGVFYRASTKDAADRIGIKGYVKNLPNGSVVAYFEGEKSRVATMVEWCHLVCLDNTQNRNVTLVKR